MSKGLRMSQEQLDAITSRLGRAIDSAPTAVGSRRRAVEDEKNRKARAMLDAMAVVKPKKYRNTPTTDADGVKHASKKQATRYRDLGLLFKSGEILLLGREIRFRLPGGVEYRADHVYATPRGLEVMAGLIEAGDLTVEDVKSPATREDKAYKIKAKQMRECLGIEIREV